MSKKAVLIFLLGVFSSGLVCGGMFLVARKPLLQSSPSHQFAVPETASVSQNLKTAVPFSPTETAQFQALFSKSLDAHSVIHAVAAKENLSTISKKYSTTVELIRKINGLESDRLSIGMKLKIPTYKFSVVADKSQNILILKGDEEVLKTYVISTGTNNSTPVGVFKVTDKLVNPTWYKAGAVVPHGSPENVLGTRWIGLSKKSYGIHGTTEPEKLGQQVTAGCIRMRNEEVEELYGFVTPSTEVTIVD